MGIDVKKKVLKRKLKQMKEGHEKKKAKEEVEKVEKPAEEPEDVEDGDMEEDGAENGTKVSEFLTKTTFASLEGKVNANLLKAVHNLGFTTMTEIQAKSIDPLLEVCGSSLILIQNKCFREKMFLHLQRLALERPWLSCSQPLSSCIS